MATSPAPGHLRVLVASEQALIAEAVRTALASRGHEALVVRWPGGPRPPAQRRPPTHGETQVGLLLSDLDRWSRIRAATLIVERISIPWMALTTSPRGPAWGGLLAAGARIVLPSTTRLDRITELLNQAARGEISMPVSERRELEDAWQEMRTRHDTAAERLSRLTPREREVLSLMYAGSSVARIAEMLEVAPATVRSQVKSVLRKLDVNTQLAAVAAFDDVLDVFNSRTAHHLPKPRPPSSPESTTPVERS